MSLGRSGALWRRCRGTASPSALWWITGARMGRGDCPAAGARVVESARGYGAACKAGADAAVAGSDILVFMDGDGADVVAELDRVVGPIERDEADFVVGSRIRGVREPGSLLASQGFAGWMGGWLLWMTQRVQYTDMGSFRAIRRTSLERLQMSEMTYGWNLEMQVKACQYALRIAEI